MPVETRPLTDLEMFEMGVSENLARKDLTPVEEARAMARYRDDFGKTSAEIGRLFGLSDSTVRNKIRLLNLPEEVKEALEDGRLTEGGARNLLPFYALPEDVRKNWEDGDQLYSHLRRESFVVQALKGEIGAEEIAQRMEAVKERRSSNLSAAWWKYTDELKSDQVRSLTCAGCELRHENICLDPACYTEKAQIYQRNYLYLASHAADIKPLEDDRHGYGEHTRLMDGYAYHQDSEERAAKAIIAGGCENLRLVFDDRNDLKQDAVHPYPDYPRAKVVCRNHSGTCRCMSGYEAVKSDAAPAVDLSAEELKKAAADKMRERREQTKLAAQLAELAGELMGEAAATLNEKALLVLITMTGTYSAQAD